MVTDWPRQRGAWQPAIAAIISALSVQAWFRPGQFIASGDISPFERRGLSRQLFWAWNHQGTPDGGAASSASRWPEVLVARLGDGLGLSGPSSQRVFLTLLAALLGASMAWMLAPLVQRFVVLVGAGLVAMATPVMLVTLPNHLALVAMSAVAIAGGAAIRTWLGRPPRPFILTWATVLVGYLTVNPPLLAVVLGFAVVAFAVALLLAGRKVRVGMATRLGFGIALALVASLIWFVPFLFSLMHPGELASFVAPIEVQQWSWTHVRSSLGNVINLTGHWTWGHPEYLPFVPRLDAQPFDWLRWALPLSVLAAPFAQRDTARRRICLGILAVSVPLIIVGKGLHEPFSGLNQWLYGHVPGLWLLREPLPKVGVILVPLYVTAWALLFEALASRLVQVRVSDVQRRLAGCGVAALAVLPLVFGWPVFTGSIYAASGPQADRAAVPAEWDVATARLQGINVAGKVLQLPLVDYYQVGTTWGYYGADTLLSGRISATVLQRLPGGYFTSRPGVDDLLGIAERALASGDFPRFEEAAGRLGIGAVVVRSDFRLDASRGGLVDPEVLRANLAKLPGASIVHDGSLLKMAGLSGRGLFTRITTVRPSNNPAVMGGTGTASVDTAQAALTKELAKGLVATGTGAGAAVNVDDAGKYRVQLADGIALTYRPALGPNGLELRPLTRLAVDGNPLPLTSLDGLGDPGDPVLLGAGEQILDPSVAAAKLDTSSGSTVSVFRPLGRDVRMNLRYVQDCAKFDERSLDEVGIALHREIGADGIFTLMARDHRACSPIALGAPTGARALRISYGEKVLAGGSAEPCLLDNKSQRCLPVQVQRASGRVDLIAALPTDAAPVTLFLYADALSSVRYEAPVVRWFGRSSDRKVEGLTPPIDLEVGRHTLSIDNVDVLKVGKPSEVGNCAGWESAADAGIREVRSVDGSIELSAERGSACVDFPVTTLSENLRVVFDYRADGQSLPRFCLWLHGLERCASAPLLAPSATGATFDHTFPVPKGATSARLFLYADSARRGERRTVFYGKVRFAEATPFVAIVAPADTPPPAAPQVLPSSVDRSGNYRMVVAPSSTPTLLRFADGWSSRWQATVQRRLLTHLPVDGFANGWILPPSEKPFVVDVVYRPSKAETFGLGLGLLVLFGVSIVEIVMFGFAAAGRRRVLREPSPAWSGPKGNRP